MRSASKYLLILISLFSIHSKAVSVDFGLGYGEYYTQSGYYSDLQGSGGLLGFGITSPKSFFQPRATILWEARVEEKKYESTRQTHSRALGLLGFELGFGPFDWLCVTGGGGVLSTHHSENWGDSDSHIYTRSTSGLAWLAGANFYPLEFGSVSLGIMFRYFEMYSTYYNTEDYLPSKKTSTTTEVSDVSMSTKGYLVAIGITISLGEDSKGSSSSSKPSKPSKPAKK